MNTHPIIKTLTDKITSELTPVDREAAFDASLDSEGEVNVAGLTFLPSRIWKEMDETAYRCGVNDFADGEPWVEIEGETYQQEEVGAIVEGFREDLETDLADLEADLEQLYQDQGSEDDHDMSQRLDEMAVKLRADIAEKRAEIEAIEKDDFFN